MAQCASELLHEGVTNIEELVRVMPFSAIREMLEAAPPPNEHGRLEQLTTARSSSRFVFTFEPEHELRSRELGSVNGSFFVLRACPCWIWLRTSPPGQVVVWMLT